MEYSADEFFDKYIVVQRKSLAWLAKQLGYSPTYVRKLKCEMKPITEAFIGRAVIKLKENPDIFIKKNNQ